MIYYLPLESYKERYTYQLKFWTEQRFKESNVAFKTIEGERLDSSGEIKVGQVLDAYGRTYYSTTQIAKLIQTLFSEINLNTPNDAVIFFEDLFTPGYEALPYIFEQVKFPPKIYTKCLAQTVDSDDFTFPWRKWMRPFEKLVSETADGIFIANSALGINMEIAQLDTASLYVTGLSFDAEEVRSRVKTIPAWHLRKPKVAFASRFDIEKQPHFFLDVVEACKSNISTQQLEFVLMTSSKVLRSTDPTAVSRAQKMRDQGKLTILTNLSKSEYYHELSTCKALLNTSLQDWQSNTLNEACALGTAPVFPAYKSFPEALNNNERFLYVPWSISDAVKTLRSAVLCPIQEEQHIMRVTKYVVEEQNSSIDKMIDVLLGHGKEYKYKPFNHKRQK